MSDARTDALNTDGRLVFRPAPWAARLSKTGAWPDAADDLQEALTPVEVSQSAGGQQLDFARMQWRLSEHLINRSQPTGFTRAVDVLLPNDGYSRLHAGDYIKETEQVEEDGEALTAESHLRPYHFGRVLPGEIWYQPGGGTVQLHGSITFNPNVSGRIYGNRSNESQDNADDDCYLWIHPLAALTDGAQAVSEQTAETWTLKNAIKSLCQACNPDETHVLNPTAESLALLDNAPSLESISLPSGQFLPDHLDALLPPNNYQWCIDYGSQAGWDKGKPTIRIFRIGEGPEKRVYQQAPGEQLNLEQTNCFGHRIARQIGDHYNAVTVLGGWQKREVTLPLYPAWPESQDSLSAEQLKKSGETTDYHSAPTAHRLWAIGEAGDLDGLRTDAYAPAGPPDLSGVLDGWTPHRLRIEPPLTYQGESGERHRRDVEVQWRTTSTASASEDPGPWKTVADTIGILPDQGAIIFSGDEPPADIVEAIQDGGLFVEMRITCTVVGDSRLRIVEQLCPGAVNGRTIPYTVDRADKFADQQVQRDGQHASILKDDAAGADERDDTDAIGAYAQKLVDQGGHAEFDGQLTLPGWHLHYEIGDLITDIAGRDISLNMASDAAPAPRYPQVIGRMWTLSEQGGPVTVLTLDSGTQTIHEASGMPVGPPAEGIIG